MPTIHLRDTFSVPKTFLFTVNFGDILCGPRQNQADTMTNKHKQKIVASVEQKKP